MIKSHYRITDKFDHQDWAKLCQFFWIDLNSIFVFIVLVTLKDNQSHKATRLEMCKYPKTGKISVPPLSSGGVTEWHVIIPYQWAMVSINILTKLPIQLQLQLHNRKGSQKRKDKDPEIKLIMFILSINKVHISGM